MVYKDRFGKTLKKGDVIDINQTVNGQNLFVIISIDPLDIRYSHDLTYKYQYSMEQLLKPCPYTGEVDFEIISNIY